MHRALHIVRRAFSGIRRRPWMHALSVVTLAASFLSFAATLTAATNVDALLSRWLGGAELTLFVRDGVTADEVSRLAAAIREIDGVRGVEVVSPEAARDKFAADLGAFGDMAAALPATAFPTAVDVSLGGALARNPAARHVLAKRLGSVRAVEEVEQYDDWFDRLAAASFVGRLAALGLGALSLVVAVLVVAAAVRTSVGARRREIEVMRFIGATDEYVRLPFLIEGAVESALAMGLALAILSALMGRLENAFADVLPLFGGGGLVRLSGATIAALLVGGCAAGAMGAALSLRRIEEV
jgi:cell division transport system permease protein